MSGFGQLLQPQHRPLVQRHAIICLVLIASAAVVYFILDWQRDLTRRELQQSSAELDVAQGELGELQAAKEELDQNLGRYDTLSAEGFIGSGDRIAWAEALLSLQRELNLPEISFELAPQKPINTTAIDPSLVGLDDVPRPDHGPLAHDMFIYSQGMHEADLLGLIEALRAKRVGYFRVNHCSMSRVAGQLGLNVECVLRWITYAPTERQQQEEEAL